MIIDDKVAQLYKEFRVHFNKCKEKEAELWVWLRN